VSCWDANGQGLVVGEGMWPYIQEVAGPWWTWSTSSSGEVHGEGGA
jgi:hypothetical protein